MSSTLEARRSGRHKATMVQGNNVKIGYANLTMMNHQVNEANLERRYVLDLLRSNCSLSALVDANERYDPPRCAGATRRNVTQRIEDWIRYDGLHGTPSSIFWLHGGAGAGKSALAQTLAEKFKLNGDLAASFFFFRTDTKRNDGNRLISTLAFQLLHSFQGITPFVEEKLMSNRGLFDKNRQTQILELLVEPLMRLSLEEVDRTGSLKLHPRLVVIDGLDECTDSVTQSDLLRLIVGVISHIPYPLRFLITSRPEPHITRAFGHDILRYNLSNDSDADKDILSFLDGEFEQIRRLHPQREHLPPLWPPRAAITSIVDRSSGHFIYASTVMRYIQSPEDHPDDRLQVIIGARHPDAENPPYAQLDTLYALIFRDIKRPCQREKIHRALGIIHLRSLKSGLFAQPWTSNRHAIEVLLSLRPGDLGLIFNRLLSLVTFDDGDLRIYHKTLFDYLLDSSRSRKHGLDLSLAHETAADHILRQIILQGRCTAEDFGNFAYHCQFAHLNSALADYLRSLAFDREIAFSGCLSIQQISENETLFLKTILYLTQTMRRQDLDPSGAYHNQYVKKTKLYFKSCLSLRWQLNRFISPLLYLRTTEYQEINIRSWLNDWRPDISYQKAHRRQIRRQAVSGVVQSIGKEHGLLSSYIKARHQYPNVITSLLVSNNMFIHSCYYLIRPVSVPWVVFLMLLTYTEDGKRLAYSEYRADHEENGVYLPLMIWKHLKNAETALNNNDTHWFDSS